MFRLTGPGPGPVFDDDDERITVDNSQRHTDPRTELVTWLTYVRGLLRFIDGRWQAKAEIAQKYQQMAPLQKKWRWFHLALGTVVLVIVFFTVGRPVLEFVFTILVYPFFSAQWADSNTGGAMAIIVVVPVLISAGLALLVLLLRNRVLLPRQQARVERTNQQLEAHNAEVRAEERQVDAQLTQAGVDFAQHVGERFPRTYLYDEAVSFCVQLVQDHRANSVMEALNLYETELHRRKVLDMHAAQLAEQQRTRKTMAVGTVVNAAMTGAAIGTMRAEGRSNRTAGAANAARVSEQLKKPRTVYVKRGGSWW